MDINDGRIKYYTKRYINVNRWTTYSEIIKRVLEIEPSNILEIGIGNRLVADILKKIGFSITVLDNDESLKPDYVMDIRDNALLQFKNKFDLVIASQVLEHIPYTDFVNVLHNISFITKRFIMTLPYCDKHNFFISWNLNLHYFDKYRQTFQVGRKIYSKKLPYNYNIKHRWEIGTKGFSLKKIKKQIKKQGWKINRNYFNHSFPYHYFFILQSNNVKQ